MFIVILPSKNEAENISHVTRVVDEGIIKYSDPSKAFILNVDSSSEDKTMEKFLATSTVTNKKSLFMDQDKLGKGYNIKEGVKFGLNNGYKNFLTLDTDVRSVEPSWIQRFIGKLENEKSDFVLPIYKRNKYEGNTTNHFSSPLVYACWGQDLRQPIAGDFGFNIKLAELIAHSTNFMDDNLYGIDTLMTWNALSHDLKIDQINLGEKIHNPSFSKIVSMFKEVCASTFNQIHVHRELIAQNLLLASGEIMPELEKNNITPRRPDENSIISLKKISQSMIDENELKLKVDDVDSDIWINHLSKTLLTIIEPSDFKERYIEHAIQTTSALYFARVCNYFKEIDCIDDDDVLLNLDKQKLKLSAEIRRNMRKPTI